LHGRFLAAIDRHPAPLIAVSEQVFRPVALEGEAMQHKLSSRIGREAHLIFLKRLSNRDKVAPNTCLSPCFCKYLPKDHEVLFALHGVSNLVLTGWQ
jgi:hypothetical protein